MPPEVREARPADSEAVRRVHRASIEGLGPAAYTDEQVSAWAANCETADYTAAIVDDASTFLVAERRGEVVGFGTVEFDDPEGYDPPVDAEITGVYVAPGVAREGVGAAILERLEAEARARDAVDLGLWASRNAVGFYERHGYTRVRERDHEFSADADTGVEGTVVEMRTSLTPAGPE